MLVCAAEGVGDERTRHDQSAATSANPANSDVPMNDWMADFRALISSYEKERWQGLNDGTESRNFVPQRMRLVKHFFDLYDSACLAKDEASTAIMELRLERLAFDPSSRWGGLF